jgi:DNA-binding IclR family transcriptional regulator
MGGIEIMMRILEDDDWHKIDELALRLGWTKSRTSRIVEFLGEHGLVQYRAADESVRLDAEFSSLMRE